MKVKIKKDDAKNEHVKMIRLTKESISKTIADMNYDELKVYLKKNQLV